METTDADVLCLTAKEEEARSDGIANANVDHAAAVRLGLSGASSTAALLIEHLLRAMHAGGEAGALGKSVVHSHTRLDL